jgi:hypothetical protein
LKNIIGLPRDIDGPMNTNDVGLHLTLPAASINYYKQVEARVRTNTKFHGTFYHVGLHLTLPAASINYYKQVEARVRTNTKFHGTFYHQRNNLYAESGNSIDCLQSFSSHWRSEVKYQSSKKPFKGRMKILGDSGKFTAVMSGRW